MSEAQTTGQMIHSRTKRTPIDQVIAITKYLSN